MRSTITRLPRPLLWIAGIAILWFWVTATMDWGVASADKPGSAALPSKVAKTREDAPTPIRADANSAILVGSPATGRR